jgi:tRNA (guanine10-N2)-dimethyltransferase
MQTSSVFILGRQPALGLAELESLFGADKVTPLPGAAVVDADPSTVPFARLGGSMKLAKLLTELPYTDFRKLIDYVDKTLPEHLQYIPEGKIKLGLSCYGVKTTPNDINRAALRIKKTVKAAGRSVRVVPNNELALGSAQVIHNQLTSLVGLELVFLVHDGKTFLAQTVAEQDIEAYAARDQKRPMRDSKVGMLPPKLAQIIINLSGAKSMGIIWDPFCGTGVLLQEALLMDIDAYGSDIDPRMIDYSQANLDWLAQKYDASHGGPYSMWYRLEVADATTVVFKTTVHPGPISAIACETYLGRPFSSTPDGKILQEVIQDVNLIHKRFLQNVASQTKAGFRLCIAVPAWRVGSGFRHLKVLDNLEELGYNRIDFVHARREDLIYHREGQVVARELVVLVRK